MMKIYSVIKKDKSVHFTSHDPADTARWRGRQYNADEYVEVTLNVKGQPYDEHEANKLEIFTGTTTSRSAKAKLEKAAKPAILKSTEASNTNTAE